jgi:hypothetical protein
MYIEKQIKLNEFLGIVSKSIDKVHQDGRIDFS